ncbi:hypothetical protein [Streptomyces sp. NPDC005435]|uniref:hypothetical protein n=1 Tax=Streptomyces sp. NPDC005435 TaxID=3154464 RepID=UPI003453A09C
MRRLRNGVVWLWRLVASPAVFMTVPLVLCLWLAAKPLGMSLPLREVLLPALLVSVGAELGGRRRERGAARESRAARPSPDPATPTSEPRTP